MIHPRSTDSNNSILRLLFQEFDDPNSTISNILEVVRDLGIAIDFAPSKLKQGVGEQAVFVLGILAGQSRESTSLKA